MQGHPRETVEYLQGQNDVSKLGVPGPVVEHGVELLMNFREQCSRPN